MEFLSLFLTVVLYVVAIILLVILIVLGIKLINWIDKADKLLDNINDKVNSLNGALAVINKTADGITNIGDSVINGVGLVTSKISSIFKRKSKKEERYYE